MQRRWTSMGTVGLTMLLLQGHAHAATLTGIQLGAFLDQFQQFVVGMGLLVGLIGLIGYIGSLLDNPFSNILAGSVGFFTKAGLLGGGTALLSFLGLTGGAIL